MALLCAKGLQGTATDYTYDHRGRLIYECRDQGGYLLVYTYDQVGNRLCKADSGANRSTFYHYEVTGRPSTGRRVRALRSVEGVTR
jgi:YD repeat-containing protein